MADIHEVLAEAWAEVVKSGVPDQVQGVAFREVLRNRLGYVQPHVSAPSGIAVPPPIQANGSSAATSVDSTDADDKFFAEITKHAAIDGDTLRRLLVLEGEAPQIEVPARDLGSSQKDQTIAVAILLSLAYVYGLQQKEFPLELVRAELERMHALNGKNFMTYIKAADGLALTGKAVRGNPSMLRVKSGAMKGFMERLAPVIDKLDG